jgi:hypothetical protein
MRAAVVIVLALAGCNGAGKDTTGETGANGATFTRVKAEVLPSCALSGCHAAGNTTPYQSLVLPAGQEHAALVNVESVDAPGQILVVPGDAAASYVIAKMEGAAGITGSPMPPPFGDLPPEQLQLMRDWIDAGALDD